MKFINAMFFMLLGIGLVMPYSAVGMTPPIPRVPFIRMYNPANNDHFYTSSREEAMVAQNSHGYRLEGDIGYLYPHSPGAGGSGSEPVYRLWNPRASKHFYTTNDKEANSAVQSGFVREGIVGYMPIADVGQNDLTVYRLYNPRLQKHFYTVSKQEADTAFGYTLEGQLGPGLFAAE